MEIQTSLHDDDEKPISAPAASDYSSKVDTSRPFRSVKEAVAIFGERFLAGEIYGPKTFSFPKQETPCFYTPSPSPKTSQDFESWRSADSNDPNLAEFLKKLEAELEETKMELRVLKEKESETEVALASLNAELHKNMSRLAQAEAAAAAKAIMASRSGIPDRKRDDDHRDGLTEEERRRDLLLRQETSQTLASRSGIPDRKRDGDHRDGPTEEERRRDLLVRLETSPTLAEMLDTAAEKEGLLGGRFKKERKTMKKKPIIPLVGDLFSRKKGSSTSTINPVYASSHVNLN